VVVLGQRDYSMRVWLDPDRLQSRNLTVNDVLRVLREQNVQVAAGQIGQQPVPTGQDFQPTLSTLGRLETPEQFGEIVLKTGAEGEVTYLRDVARVELGARNEDTAGRRDGKPSPALIVFLLPGSNALDTADGVKAKLREMEARFPKGLRYDINYDTTPFVREPVGEVFNTLRDAIILVAVVILLFLQDWKALPLPVIDVEVALVGTFAVMALMGFTLDNLTLFGLVLAIGIVVDDSIVVLENIERHLEMGQPVREATVQAMQEITGPIVAITLVLSSVLLPSAFLSGVTGQFFRQFALAISVTMLTSTVNAMTVTPARGVDLRPPQDRRSGRPGQGGAAVVELRPARRAGDRVAPGADPGHPARPARGRRVGGVGGRGRPGGHPASVGHLRRPLPARRGRRRGGRVVRHSTRELGSGAGLPGLQPALRAGDAGLRDGRGLVPPARRPRARRMRGPGRPDGARPGSRAQGVRPGPGQGLPGREHPVARRRLAGADGRGERVSWEGRAGGARGRPHVRRHRDSDGLPEAMAPGGEPFGENRLIAAFRAASRVPLADAVRGVIGEVEGWAGPGGPQDDVSVVTLEVE
jgi:hypothetical protein